MPSRVKRVRGQLTYANVTATIALVLALGMGSAWAAGNLGKDTVKSKQIKAGAVRGKELADDAVTSSKVDNHSLFGEDFADGQLPEGPEGPKGNAGARGPQGVQGVQGLQGIPGPTFAFVGSALEPVATPDLHDVGLDRKFTTTSAGKLFVMFSTPFLRVDCTGGNDGTAGLYVDQVAVPETKRPLTDDVGTAVSVFGITASSVPAGTHTLDVGLDCGPGDNGGNTGWSGAGSEGAILLGG
jgi:hypothetical protein